MKYNRVFIESIGYELAPVVVSSSDLEARLEPLYKALHFPLGQLEALTGITERRWWDKDYPPSDGAAAAAKKALANSGFSPQDIDVLIYAGVCREQLEPATACRVASKLNLNPDATVFDLSNACLGVLNGIIEIANRIELGQCRAGLVVSCETARDINEAMIDKMLETKSIEVYKQALATLTGGSGAVAVLVVNEELSTNHRRQLLGGVSKHEAKHHSLCQWGWESFVPESLDRFMLHEAPQWMRSGYTFGMKHCVIPFMATDAGAVLKFGVELGLRTWLAFLHKIGWAGENLDKVICHQVGSGHREAIMKTLNIPLQKDFSTYQFLGNIGTVSLPLTAALAEESNFLQPGNKVGFLGIGSGLNCMMLGLKW
ncbi:3-oxoacyl-ACP synthase III [Telmatocola sphagniphila]|uniref:3-oxoacyl-ACP synthase III n=1 Tax=Telmatocola sphagniphila TaxID=1123043 RepID=A0A8E6B8C4_9BACT|nr:3-oxoacyl-ACP synthase III [Telmatocola sphagniphila]QVL33359.1 3-oxoacyl-ACP synthase III [Telmatocola sphagniphila]